MESKKKIGDNPRKNFLKPEFDLDQMMNKREKFAVSLRKEKTKALVQ